MRFRNNALRRFWERNDARRLPPDMLGRISDFLDDLDASQRTWIFQGCDCTNCPGTGVEPGVFECPQIGG